jgi:hypothetical protein
MFDSHLRTEQVRQLAYDRWEREGRRDGHDLEDWAWAEANVPPDLSQVSATAGNGASADGAGSNGKSDESSAPESGTVRDETSGNQPSQPEVRPTTLKARKPRKGSKAAARADDPANAGEER